MFHHRYQNTLCYRIKDFQPYTNQSFDVAGVSGKKLDQQSNNHWLCALKIVIYIDLRNMSYKFNH